MLYFYDERKFNIFWNVLLEKLKAEKITTDDKKVKRVLNTVFECIKDIYVED